MPVSMVVDRTLEIGQFPGSGLVQRARNISGATVAEGAIVVVDATGTNADVLYSFSTTTTANDSNVMGVLVNGPVENGRIGEVMIQGFADKVLVDGTTDIAAGDHLGTFTTAGIAAKTTSPRAAIAVALEAYTNNDSNGEIKALVLGHMAQRQLPEGGTPYVMVAASDAPQTQKDSADYICDGTADQTEINTAFGDLPASGGVVLLSEGNFSITVAAGNPSITMTSAAGPAVLQGMGRGVTTIKLADSQSSTYVDLIRVSSNHSLRDFTLDGNKANQTDGNVWTNQRGIQSNNGSTHSNIDIRNLEVKNVVYIGIVLNRVDGIRIDNVEAHTCGLVGIHIGGSSTSSNATVSNCIFRDNSGATDETGGDQDGFVADDVTRLTLANCISEGNEGDGFHLENVTDFTMVGCVAQGNTAQGIIVASGAEDGGVIGCTATDNGGNGIQSGAGGVMPAVIGCHVSGNGANGIYCRAGIVTSISGNYIVQNDEHGILLEGANFGGSVTNNYLNNNSIATTNTYDGIHLAELTAGTDCTGVIISGNRIQNSSHRYGIREAASDQDSQIVFGNRITAMGTGEIGLQGANSKAWRNDGWVTENSGTATIASGTTSITVTHGLDVTPAAANISIVATENPTNDPGNFWVDTITSTQFNINCRSDPGASNLDFAWHAIIT